MKNLEIIPYPFWVKFEEPFENVAQDFVQVHLPVKITFQIPS
eukprot:UN09392